MQVKNLPAITARYWSAILAASMCGANTGDFLARNLHLGHTLGLLPLAVLFSVILWAERRAKLATEAYYWLAVIVLRTAATNLADLATHDLKLGYGLVELGLTLLLIRHPAHRFRARPIDFHRSRNPRSSGVEFARNGCNILGGPADGRHSWYRNWRFHGGRSRARVWIGHPWHDLWHRPAGVDADRRDGQSLVLGEHCRRAIRWHHNGRPTCEASGAPA